MFRLIVIVLSLFSTIFSTELTDSIISSLTLREKAGQMILVYNSPTEFLKKSGVGGVLVMSGMLKNREKLITGIKKSQKELEIPLLVSIDQEGGTVNRLSRTVKWKNAPSAKRMSGWSADSITSYHNSLAKDLSDLGVNINLAPVLDPEYNHDGVLTHIGNEERSFGTSSENIITKALAFSAAFTNMGIGTVIKHFPGYNIVENSDKYVSISNADSLDVEENMETFLKFGNSATAVMMASVLYKKFCNKPAVFCSNIVEKAREINPNIIVMTDDLWGTAVRSFTYPNKAINTVNYPDSAFEKVVELSILAGNDMLMITYPAKVELMINKIVEMAKNNKAVLNHVNNAVERILLAKEELGLFKNRAIKIENSNQ